MNIRVDLETSIKDGTEVVFRSPVDCSQITGLIVYYKESGKTASKEFALADAHGNNVGDIDHLFAENVVVKVILDVAHGMAFVQNADTNAYLEGRFDGIIDKLCPTFEETGLVVQCEPVEGTLLKGTFADGGLISITVCGKNLYDKDTYPLLTNGKYQGWAHRDSGILVSSENFRRTSFIPVAHLAGQTINLNHAPTSGNSGMVFYSSLPDIEGDYPNTADNESLKAAFCGGGRGSNITVPDNAQYMIFSVPVENATKDLQIEIGSAATDYEPYWERKAIDWDSAVVMANKGINTVVCYAAKNGALPAEITVTGKADPVAIIDKLTNAVLSLGGNI